MWQDELAALHPLLLQDTNIDHEVKLFFLISPWSWRVGPFSKADPVLLSHCPCPLPYVHWLPIAQKVKILLPFGFSQVLPSCSLPNILTQC